MMHFLQISLRLSFFLVLVSSMFEKKIPSSDEFFEPKADSFYNGNIYKRLCNLTEIHRKYFNDWITMLWIYTSKNFVKKKLEIFTSN